MRKKIIIANVLAAMMLIGTTGCGSSSGDSTKYKMEGAAANTVTMGSAEVQDDYDYEYAADAEAIEESKGITDYATGGCRNPGRYNQYTTYDRCGEACFITVTYVLIPRITRSPSTN